MAIEQRLSELKGSSRLALGFFNSLIRRIESTKPIAGKGLTIVQKDDGMEINITSAGVNSLGFNKYDITICENGSTKTITVYGP